MVGGYQIIDFKGLRVTVGQAYPLVDAKLADTFRNCEKPLYATNLFITDTQTYASGWLGKITTGAYDGVGYSSPIGSGSVTITTNGDIVSILINN